MFNLIFIILVVLWQLIPTPSVHAVLGVGDTVFDVQAYTQQLLNYATQLQQYQTQTQQYQTQMQQLENEYMNLHSLGYQIDLSNLNEMHRIMTSSVGINNNFGKMQGEFQKLYPDFKTYQGQKSTDYVRQSAEWSKKNQQNAYDILTVTTKLQDSVARDQKELKYLSNRSNSASGTKDLLQNMNQLLILQTKQLMQLQQLISATAKADAAYLAEKTSDDASSREVDKDLFRNWGNDHPLRPAPKPGKLLR